MWKQLGLTITNNKGESTTNVGDYGAPARFYKNSEVIIAYPGMTKIVIEAISEYVDGWNNVTLDNANVEINETTVTIIFSAPVDSITITMTAQSRASSITVYSQTEPCQHTNQTTVGTVDATCGKEGYTGDLTCSRCGEIITKGQAIPATGTHNYVAGTCSVCGTPDPNSGNVQPTWEKVELADIKSTDVIVIVWTKSDGKSYAMRNDKGTSAPTPEVVTINGNQLTGDIADYIKWNISNNGGTLTIYPNGKTSTWLYCTSNNNGVRVGTNTNKTFTIDTTSGYLKHIGTSRYLGVYNTQDIRCYTSSTATNIANQTLSFYKYTEGTTGGETPAPECTHTNITTENTATCTEAGTTTVTCNDCGKVVSTTETAALGHNYVDGTCSVCGGEDPDYEGGNQGGSTEPTDTVEATLSFASKDNRTSYSTSKQVWKENGITLTNDKSSSQNNVADYANPARFYAGSKITITVTGRIAKIVFDCNSSTYATALKNSIGVVSTAGVAVENDKVTIEFVDENSSFTINSLTAQIRMDSITVTYTPAN